MSFFYDQHLRKLTTAFGALFDEMVVTRYDSDGNALHQEIVPLSYSNKSPFFATRIRREQGGTDRDPPDAPAMKLPRMGFEMTSIQYDPTRSINPRHKIKSNTSHVYAGKPFNVGFSLYIDTKTQTEALQLIEQIIPFFSPYYTVNFKSMSEPNIAFDVPISLINVQPNIEVQGQLATTNPSLTWQLDFMAPTYLYTRPQKNKLIRHAYAVLDNEQGNGDSITLAEPYIDGVAVSDIEANGDWAITLKTNVGSENYEKIKSQDKSIDQIFDDYGNDETPDSVTQTLPKGEDQ